MSADVFYGHGMIARERDVMDLFESGVRRQDIAARLDMTLGYVKAIVSRYSINTREVADRNAMIASASAALRDACLQLAARGSR